MRATFLRTNTSLVNISELRCVNFFDAGTEANPKWIVCTQYMTKDLRDEWVFSDEKSAKDLFDSICEAVKNL